VAEEAKARVRASGLAGRVFDAARLHVTLEFLGRINEAQCVCACRAAETVHNAALDLVFDRALSFDTPSRPFVLTGGAALDPVRRLRAVLASALADHGFQPRAAYIPHMTLCYDRSRKVAEHVVAPLGFHAGTIDFMVSHVGQSRHERIASWPLVERAASS
jgi:2'-5' RNA ligase